MNKILDLQNHRAMISGAGQGIGRAIAIRFAEHGAQGVVVNDYHLDRAEATAEMVRTAGCEGPTGTMRRDGPGRRQGHGGTGRSGVWPDRYHG